MKIFGAIAGIITLLLITGGLSAQKKLVIIGSSTSACVNVDPTLCYVSRLNAYYNQQPPSDTTIDNHLARGGTNCYNGMPSWYVSPYPAASGYLPITDINITTALTLNPDVILVNYPTNGYDVLAIDEIMFCLRTIKNEANKNGIPCYVTTTQPRTTPPNFSSSAVKLKLAILKDSILAAFGNYAIDFYTGLINPADSTILYDSGDQTHMNGTGHDSLFHRVLAKNVFGLPVVPAPGCVTNTLPADGSTIATQTSATLNWPAAANASSYDVYVWTGATAPASPIGNVSSTTYTVGGLTASTVYNWYIVPKNATGPAVGCGATNKTSFATAAAPLPVPSCVVNSSPADGSTVAAQTSATLNWPAAANASSYDVFVWTGATAPASPTANVTATSYSASGLTASTVYNWYIVPKNATGPAAGCGATNKTSFTTAAVPPPPPPPAPSCVVNTSPADGATVAAQTSATLSWPAAANASSYDVYVWTGATAPASPTASVAATSYSASGLTASTLYNWFIVPKNATGPAAGCGSTNKTTFTTAAVPPPPPPPAPACVVNTSPADGSTVAAQTSATLSWPAAANASSYDVYVWTGAIPSTTPVANVATNSYTATGLTAATWYGWYIAPKNASGAAAGCAATNKTSFITAAIPPPPPPPMPSCVTNTSPADGSTVAAQTSATLSWPAAANASSYDVFVWTGTTAPASPTANVTVTSYSVTGLTASTLYNWYIVPKNATGPATGCGSTNKTTFTTAAVPPPPPPPAPACVVNTSPADGSTVAAQTSATLSWPAAANASSYDVYVWTGATAPASPTTNVTATSYSVTGLTASTLYNWYIVPKNATGPATGCGSTNKTTFTTAAVPPPPPPPVPACAVNTSPADGSTVAAQTSATLTWPAVANASSYDVYLWTGATLPVYALGNVTSPTYIVGGLTASTVYNWYVVPRNATGPATGCGSTNKTSFTTAAVPPLPPPAPAPLPVVPACVTNTLPVNGTTIGTQTSAALSWPADATASSYDVYLWTGATVPASPVATVTTTNYNASGLTASTIYNWYIVPVNSAGPATGCSVANQTNFTTAAVPPPPPPPVPACAVNTSPADGSTVATQTSATLTWPAVANASSYDVYFWTGATLPVYALGNVTSPTYIVGGLTASTVYNWYVVPRNATGPAVGCSATNKTSFTTAAAPPPPAPLPAVPACVTNSLPANGTIISTQTSATLSWPAAANASSYDVYFWTGTTVPAYALGNVTSTSYIVGGLTPSTLYNWYVVPVNSVGRAACDANNKTSFTTAAAPSIPPASGTGLLGVYYNGTSFSGTPLLARIDSTINFELTSASPVPGIVPQDFYSVRWTGQVQPMYSETYTFYTTSDDGIRLWVNGVQLVNDWVRQGATEMSGSINLVAGQKYDIVIEYYEAAGYAVTKLAWSSPSTPKAIIPASALYPAASAADMQSVPLATPVSVAAAASASLLVPAISSVLSPNPVPAGGLARLQIISDKRGTAVINTISSNGIVLHSGRLPLAVGVTTTSINTSGLPGGCYFISIKGGDKPIIMKLIVQ